MDNLSFHDKLGIMTWLLSHSDYHRQWSLFDVDLEIVPPILHQQFRLYFDENKTPVGFATWAWLTDEAKARLINNRGPLEFDDWWGGEHLMFNDFVAPWGHTREILRDLRGNIFSKHKAFSLGRNADGSIRKVYQWKGFEYQGKVLSTDTDRISHQQIAV